MSNQTPKPQSQARTPQSRRRLTERGRRVRDGALVLLALGAVATVAGLSNKQNQSNKQKTKIEALQNSNTVMENIVVLKSGADVRAEPIGASDANNRTGSVGTDQEWVIHTPLVTGQPGTLSILESGWIAFTPPNTNLAGIKSLEDRADATVYANLQALEDQGLAQVYSYPAQSSYGPGESGGSLVLNASVSADGKIKISNMQSPVETGSNTFVDPPAASSYADTAGNYATQLQGNTSATSTASPQMAVTTTIR